MKQIINFFTNKAEKAWKDLTFLLLFFGVAIFQFLGRIPLLEPDEGRYAEIAREMLEKMDFITPHLNYVKYFEKPPLLYWLNALSLSVFGNNEFGARFPTALAGLGGILVTYHIGRKIFGRREALFSALVLGTSVGYLAQARMNIIDMTLTFCMTASLGCFLIAMQDKEQRKGLYFHLFYLFAALTVLAKGVIGLVLPGAVIFCYIALSRHWRLLREMRLATGVPLFLVVCVPWFVLVSLDNPEFARFFFIHEHVERFLTKVHSHYEPIWYFIPVLLGCMFPWSLLLPATVLRLRKEKLFSPGSPVLFLGLWVIVILGFFSLSSSKLIPYILPIFPAVALLIGRALSLACEEEEKTLRINALIVAVITAVLGVAAVLYPFVAHRPKLGVLEVAVMGAILVAEGVAALLCLRRAGVAGAIGAFCLLSFLFTIVGPQFIFGNLARRKATPELARIIKQKYEPGVQVASYGWYQQGIPFYTGLRVMVVGAWGELDFGRSHGDNAAWFPDYPTFNRLWNSPARLLVLVRKRDFDRLLREVKTPVLILAREGDQFLIANH
jgi:4-amino-4-deoxy-L-arabinose transferase-like glycosyltransferase